jgi:hypothetical protein
MEGSIQAGGAPGGTSGGRGMRIGEILDAALKLYRGSAVNLWLIALVITLPTEIVIGLISKASLPSGVFAHHGTLYIDLSVNPGGQVSVVGSLATIVLNVLANLVTVGALVECLLNSHLGRDSSWSTSLRFALPRLGSLLWLSILTTIGLVIGFILVIVPGIYLYVCWCIAIPVLMFEGKTGTKALGRSNQLVKGRWWATFGALLASFVMIVIVYAVVVLLLQHLAVNSENSVNAILILRVLFEIITFVLIYPIFAAVSVMIYIDLRTRKEAFDLETFADSLSATSPTAVAASTFGTPTPPDNPPAGSSAPPPPSGG